MLHTEVYLVKMSARYQNRAQPEETLLETHGNTGIQIRSSFACVRHTNGCTWEVVEHERSMRVTQGDS